MRICALALVVLLCPRTVWANDAAFGGKGSELIPLATTPIRLNAEDITLELKGKPLAWTVIATYQFENPTGEVAQIQMGFPESRCGEHDDDEDCSGAGGEFRGLKTTVRGVAVKQRTGKVSRKSHEWAPRLGKVYLYDVTFAPHEKVDIVHRYTFDRSPWVHGEFVNYVTRTGGLWKEPIGRARFVILTTERPWAFSYPDTFKLASYLERPGSRRNATIEIVFEMQNWKPTADLDLALGNLFFAQDHDTLGAKCPEWSSATPATIAELPKSQLRLCRNLPFARHGMPFKSPDLRAAFYQPDQADREHRSMIVGFRENPLFNDSLLSDDERGWVKLFEAAEKTSR